MSSSDKTIDLIVFDMFKTIIIEQNKMLLTNIAKDLNKDPDEFMQKYLQPSYYLPVFLSKQP